ncbi:crotonase/enoyl-CoA hydratase family protein [uncultured Cohaesibacter sp.]|uniref:crotonase/enoyl-CoA hydratase family protein n=1 Tax=uncultured Cohaesibacter sp. TaxID=1002546 RepID=UPI0029C9426D|nr:crotonase/enoyl-CoA hydratase family protein [uncultured Cohaesibacter sp.]
MSYQTIRIEQDEQGIACVTLNRPDKHNAMNEEMIMDLTQAAASLGGDERVRVILLAGEGKSFCAGGDLGWMQQQAGKDREGKIEQASMLAAMLASWNSMPKPVVGRVHGAVYGGGMGLVAICDVVVAADDCRFALTETRLGLVPATIGPFVLSRLGGSFARQVFFNARPFDAEFLMRAGLVAHICVAAELDDAARKEAGYFLECAPGAVADAKALCRKLAGADPGAMKEMTANALADRWETSEAQAGIEAFFAKTSPPWRTGY